MAHDPPGAPHPTVKSRPAAKRILIAEDEPNIVISLEFLLRSAGYEVSIARDGSEALRLISALNPDLIVLDIMLPVVNGHEVCRRVREGAVRDTKILMLTAHGRESDVKKGIAAGADAYVTKPFATRDLVRTVADLLTAGKQ
ncbi:MAG TPA: response regulator [Burkholderiales bacterium]|nr:response regulator [Burkholderiales bacterium]